MRLALFLGKRLQWVGWSDSLSSMPVHQRPWEWWLWCLSATLWNGSACYHPRDVQPSHWLAGCILCVEHKQSQALSAAWPAAERASSWPQNPVLTKSSSFGVSAMWTSWKDWEIFEDVDILTALFFRVRGQKSKPQAANFTNSGSGI